MEGFSEKENKSYMDSYRDRIVIGCRSIRSHTVLYCTVQYFTRPVPYPTVSHSTAPHTLYGSVQDRKLELAERRNKGNQ